MNHNDESYATMLLVASIRPDREELVEPLTSEEWYALRKRLRKRNLRVNDLIGMDMSAIMMRLEISEEEAYRIYLLLSRMLPLSISLEKLAMRGIDETTYAQPEYPSRLRLRLGPAAPAMLYFCGKSEIFRQDAIAVLGAIEPRGNVKTEVAKLVERAVSAGYVIVTDGTKGISRIARSEAISRGGKVIEVLPGEMGDRIETPEITAAIAKFEASVVTETHPDKLCTLASAQARNRIIYALSQAAFVFGVERNSGAVFSGACENLKKRWCTRLYCWNSSVYEDNQELIRRGATPFSGINDTFFVQMRAQWLNDESKQLCMFDNDEPL